ncbi:Spy/CpxP family protein refolding chaperone [Bradyrhizobium sp. G127]|uniref:Spy/CpxP family protein refolding chaperone n=1 Tax=Bradyrhizobium sp. G127 TaxID=2904800 RepID=UPI001F1B9BAC|nr:Spy/CpxP family protein refolding chaperone [Bradyrhizobium sp. G127]MCF2521683.1 Spy/CpxP family protein refolding chaperone [Bradyrhizobium sp. G127]
MKNSVKLLAIAAASAIIAAFGYPQSVSVAGQQSPSRFIVAMDDMKSMQPDSSKKADPGMGTPGGQSPKMGRMMDDDKMEMPQKDQDKMGSGSMNQPGGMMMERMMRQMCGMPGTAGTAASTDITDRTEGRIAFLKAELQISDKQVGDWNALADALRSARSHLVQAQQLVASDKKITSAERLEAYEKHLAERLEAVKSSRAAYNRLYAALNEEQRRTSDTILLPLIGAF